MFKRNEYYLYKFKNGSYRYIKIYKRYKINSALIDHIASIIPEINKDTLKILHRSDEHIAYYFESNDETESYLLALDGNLNR